MCILHKHKHKMTIEYNFEQDLGDASYKDANLCKDIDS